MKKYVRLFLAFALSFLLASAPAFSQAFSSNLATVNLSMSVGETLTVSATPASITFLQTGSTATASGPITVVTMYNIASGHPNLRTWAWLSSPTAALTNGTTNIPAADVLAAISGHTTTPATACNIVITDGVVANVSGATCPFIENNATPAAGSGSFTDSVLLSLSSLPSLTPGTYTGVLNIQAEAN